MHPKQLQVGGHLVLIGSISRYGVLDANWLKCAPMTSKLVDAGPAMQSLAVQRQRVQIAKSPAAMHSTCFRQVQQEAKLL